MLRTARDAGNQRMLRTASDAGNQRTELTDGSNQTTQRFEGCRMKVIVVISVLLMAACTRGMSNESLPHPCERTCRDGQKPMVCAYNFTIEWYYSMSKACFNCPVNLTDCSRPHCVATDGSERGIIVANRQLPGPAITVCEGDEIVVNIDNKMVAETTTIHWHGIHQRNGTAHMDGVPMVTQCPIQPHSKFQYRFISSPGGTHFWHSHTSTQRMDGLMGALVVHQPPSADPNSELYDFDLSEHVFIVQDWLKEVAINRFTSHHHQGVDNKPRSILINGKGAYDGIADPNSNRLVYTPREVFKVTQGYRYRFRAINVAGLNCPLLVSIDGHNLTVIASDGVPMEPFDVESIVIYAGERFDFILTANNTVDNYWMKVKGLADCSVKFARQTAIIRYEGSAEVNPRGGTGFENMNREGIILNPLNSDPSDTLVPIVEMNTTLPDDPASSKPEADVKFYVGFDFRKIEHYHFYNPSLYPLSELSFNKLYTPQLNNISMVIPASPPLYQYENTPKEKYCDSTTVTNCSSEFCECAHTLRVKLKQVVEIIMVNEGVTFDVSHPMHIHGYSFRVVAQGKVGRSVNIKRVMEMDMAGNITRKLSRAPLKDTVIVPDGGYTVIRFYADNPGMWLLHCHLAFHLEIGMMLMIQVGDPRQFPKVPKSFPRCGDYPSPFEPKEPPTPPQPKPKPCINVTAGAPTPLLNSSFIILVICALAVLQ